MKQIIPLIAISLLVIVSSCRKRANSNDNSRESLFDTGWKFIKDDPSGAENPNFDDSEWRVINLPHDWSIEDLPKQNEDSIIGPFTRTSMGKMSTGYTVGGTAWYRKNFIVDKENEHKVVYLRFDGVYMNSDLWVNGKHVGNHPHGYTSFYYDITPYLNPPGHTNVVAMQVKNEGRNARWYTGSGIYRHAWLGIVNPIHIAVWGVNVTTPVVTENSAEISIATTLVNAFNEVKPVTVQTQLFDRSGKIVGTVKSNTSLSSNGTTVLSQKITIEKPDLWSIENPNLYQARVSVITEATEVDKVSTPFGVRSIHFDAQTGFTLNGKNIKLKGGCFHHDNGPLGSAAIDRAEERKIELLKNAGFNAIRCSHNPPSPYLLDVCDRLGMLVVDELYDMWETPKISANDYSKYFRDYWKQDVESMVVRDRSHPSIIMWSIGNEIPETADTIGLRIAKSLAMEVRDFDSTRAVTEAMVDFAGFFTGISSWENQAPHMNLLDVVGYNYAYDKYEEHHRKYPSRIMYASEFMPPLALQNWQMVEDHPYVIGSFSWTAIDNLGESGVGIPRLVDSGSKNVDPTQQVMIFFNPESWPAFINYQGDLDLIGNRKVASYYQHVVWRESKIEMFAHEPIPNGKDEVTSPWGFPDEFKSWNWAGHEGEKIQVHVYSRSQLVRLELNGKVIGEQAINENKSITATFEVPYESGTLIARGFDNGKEIASEILKTTGEPVAIRLVADKVVIKTSPNDLSYVSTEVIDAAGNVVPSANNVVVNYEVSGPGEIVGVGNGSPTDMSSFKQPRKKVYRGKCLVIIRPTGQVGKIILKASATGLQESLIEIDTKE